MTKPLRIAMLLTDAYGGFGGVARFNRDFLEALDASPQVERVQAFPRLIGEPIAEPVPESVVLHRNAACGAGPFLRAVAGYGSRVGETDIVICGHLNLLAPAWALARRQGAKLALIIHGIDAWKPSSHKLANLLAGKVDLVISVSSHTARLFQQWSHVPDERVALLPNCVDLSAFAPALRDPQLAARYGLEASRVIMTVGRLDERERYKGFDEVLEVMPDLVRRHPDLKYLIVGTGSDLARLRAKAEDLGLAESVIFTGRIAEEEKAAHYNLADAYVMPGRGEGFGIVYLEAAACGVPVIGSILDGSRDALLDGKLGALVDPDKPDAISAAIRDVLDGRINGGRKAELSYFNKTEFKLRVEGLIGRIIDNAPV